MLSKRIRVLDFDGSLLRQPESSRRENAELVDLRSLGKTARLWASASQAAEIRKHIDSRLRESVTFIGSGDFHYVSDLLLAQYDEPLTLIVFDHHPDWDRLPPKRGCGAWIARAIERRNIQQVLLVGNASDDLKVPSPLTGSHQALRHGKIVSLPWTKPATDFPTLSGLPWRPLGNDPLAVLAETLDELVCKKVYLSIDKDCLTAKHALTNWEEGCLDLSLLTSAIGLIRERCDIIGADITGEFSPIHHHSAWKRFCSWIDHPANFSAKGRREEEIDRINGRTNQQLLEALLD